MNKHVLSVAASKLNTNINCDLWDFKRARELEDRRVYLYGSTNKVKDRVAFEDRFENEVVKPFVLEHSKMSEEEYDKLDRKVRLFPCFFLDF